jgi:hypothetical protein
MEALAHSPGDVISYLEMCQAWSASLQRGMNFRLRPNCSVILMSRRKNAPYNDCAEEDGRVLIYEGHDAPKRDGKPDPKGIDQPRLTPARRLTQNGLFDEAAKNTGSTKPELVAVYEKIQNGIWVFNGFFHLTDSWLEHDGKRKVFKFRLQLVAESVSFGRRQTQIDHNRLIPSAVKLQVWKRDAGKCVLCGAKDNLHYDHDLPYSKGGSSLTAANIRLLCARHNLAKSDRIE